MYRTSLASLENDLMEKLTKAWAEIQDDARTAEEVAALGRFADGCELCALDLDRPLPVGITVTGGTPSERSRILNSFALSAWFMAAMAYEQHNKAPAQLAWAGFQRCLRRQFVGLLKEML